MARHAGRCGCFANPFATNARCQELTAHAENPRSSKEGPAGLAGDRDLSAKANTGTLALMGAAPARQAGAQIQGCAENAGTPERRGSRFPDSRGSSKGKEMLSG